jgi:hypothetical protein
MVMNIRRGLFRFWLVFTALFVAGSVAFNLAWLSEEFRLARLNDQMSSDILLIPGDCRLARGREGADYTARAGDATCWYELPKFRILYPEYTELSDDELAERAYRKAGIPTTPIHPWFSALRVAGVAVGVPTVLFVLGSALLWAIAGFHSERSPKRHQLMP